MVSATQVIVPLLSVCAVVAAGFLRYHIFACHRFGLGKPQEDLVRFRAHARKALVAGLVFAALVLAGLADGMVGERFGGGWSCSSVFHAERNCDLWGNCIE